MRAQPQHRAVTGQLAAQLWCWPPAGAPPCPPQHLLLMRGLARRPALPPTGAQHRARFPGPAGPEACARLLAALRQQRAGLRGPPNPQSRLGTSRWGVMTGLHLVHRKAAAPRGEQLRYLLQLLQELMTKDDTRLV